MKKLKIITSTTRPGRKGPAIAEWFKEQGQNAKEFDIEVIDLGTLNLPLMDEPNHPRMQNYQHEHTKKWSEIIKSADAFAIVLAEYNYSFPAPIKNALDYLYNEWSHKPVGFISYGGPAGGVRSQQMLKQVVTTMQMMPLVESISIHMFTQYFSPEGKFVGDEKLNASAQVLLKELTHWSNSLAQLREQKKLALAK
jgi:NAD(P)H-dependent FMN reductase